MSLSDKAKEWYCAQAELDVKEFIKELKEDVKDNSLDGLITMDFVLLWIDKLAGDDLK